MDPGSTPRLRVTVTDDKGRAVRAPGLAAWVARIVPASARGELAIAIVSDARMRTLNKKYRRKDTATDVLSFDTGDIVIAEGVARRQARDAGHAYGTELRILALHGLLHLMGYDHHDPADQGRMARMERRLGARGGLRAGLIERASAPAAGARRRSGAVRSAAASRSRKQGWGPASPKP